MNPSLSEHELHAYVDGELGVERRAAVEQYLAQDSETAARVADYREQNEALHALFDGILDEPVPERFTRPARAPRWSLLRVAAAVGWLALGAVLGLSVMYWRDTASYEAAVMRPALVAYGTFVADKNHAVEVGADQEAAMRNWLSKRMDVQLAIPKFDAQGYALLGGRLLPGTDRPNCQLVYQRSDGKRVALFMTRERGSEMRGVSFDQRGNAQIAHWSNGTLSFVIAGETTPEELRTIADAARAQLGPKAS